MPIGKSQSLGSFFGDGRGSGWITKRTSEWEQGRIQSLKGDRSGTSGLLTGMAGRCTLSQIYVQALPSPHTLH